MNVTWRNDAYGALASMCGFTGDPVNAWVEKGLNITNLHTYILSNVDNIIYHNKFISCGKKHFFHNKHNKAQTELFYHLHFMQINLPMNGF